MLRTSTLAIWRITLLAALMAWSCNVLAQSSTHSSSDRSTTYRRDTASGSTWQPTRPVNEPSRASTSAQGVASPKKWLMPTQASGRAKIAAQQEASNSKVITVPTTARTRTPKPFVPPVDAQELSPADTELDDANEVAPTVARQQPRSSKKQPANSAEQAVALSNPQPRQTDMAAKHAARPNPQPNRNSQRPRSATTAGRVFDDSWIRPLRQVAYQDGAPEELSAPPGQPSLKRMRSSTSMIGPEIHTDGEWIGSPDGSPFGGSCGPDGCGPDCECGPLCGDGVMCGDTCGCHPQEDLWCVGPHDDESCHTIRIRVPKFQEVMIYAGVHGFKGPYDQDRNSGNFGFQEGFNIGAKLPFFDYGYQFGYQAVQSQLSGDENTGIGDSFAQHFFTTGVFQRAHDGLQGGIAWDLLLDERDTSVSFSQLRAEFGFVDSGMHEIGISIAVHLDDNVFVDVQQQTTTAFQTVDQYLLYYRMHGPRGGEGRAYGGLTDDADGIIGADFMVPLTDSWSLQPGFTYLIPSSSGNSIAASEEAWNIGINLVWHWKGHARSSHSNPYRPLFNVADNGYMIVDDRP